MNVIYQDTVKINDVSHYMSDLPNDHGNKDITNKKPPSAGNATQTVQSRRYLYITQIQYTFCC